MQQELYHQIVRRYIGEDVAVFRSMFMNKPAYWDQTLPWHQDIGQGWGIDDNPTITIWLALDEATAANGCMQIVPSSHRHGVINEKHMLPPEKEAEYAPPQEVIDLEVAAGEAVLLHNFLLHRSGENPTSDTRRAFSMTFMDAEVRTLDTGQKFPVVFGRDALHPQTMGDKAEELVQKFYG
jgi:ectoine hydroxylase-related dioxygenase (phytanoyl-CoA dioxygenase family)